MVRLDLADSNIRYNPLAVFPRIFHNFCRCEWRSSPPAAPLTVHTSPATESERKLRMTSLSDVSHPCLCWPVRHSRRHVPFLETVQAVLSEGKLSGHLVQMGRHVTQGGPSRAERAATAEWAGHRPSVEVPVEVAERAAQADVTGPVFGEAGRAGDGLAPVAGGAGWDAAGDGGAVDGHHQHGEQQKATHSEARRLCRYLPVQQVGEGCVPTMRVMKVRHKCATTGAELKMHGVESLGIHGKKTSFGCLIMQAAVIFVMIRKVYIFGMKISGRNMMGNAGFVKNSFRNHLVTK